MPHHEGIREKTLNNENLAGPHINRDGINGDHSDLVNRTHNNENLTAPTPDRSIPLEKDFSHSKKTCGQLLLFDADTRAGPYGNGYHQHLDDSHDSETALRKIRTAGSISITPELFEKLYLSPQNKVAGELRKTVGNPTPL